MKKIILGFLFGSVVVAILAAFVVKSQEKAKYEYGWNNGYRNGQLALADIIEKEFGRVERLKGAEVICGIKLGAVVAIETNGVKTVRIHRLESQQSPPK